MTPLYAATPVHTLSGFDFTFQTFNNCGPASLSIFLSHFGLRESQDLLKAELRQGDRDPAVTFPEIESSLRSRGFFTAFRFGGDLPLVKKLLAGGHPVLLRFWLKRAENDQLGHTVLAIGYDDIKEALILEDPLHGSHYPWPYKDLEASWGPYNYAFLTAALPGGPEVDSLKGLLAPLGDFLSSAKAAEAKARDVLKNKGSILAESFQWFNLGTSLWAQKRWNEATTAYQKSWDRGWPWRVLWYQSYPLECWYRVGDFRLVKTVGEWTLRGNKDLPEVKAWVDAVTPRDVHVYISDSHAGSFYHFASLGSVVPRKLINFDSHADLWPTAGQETLPWVVSGSLGKILEQWKADSRVQCFSWILPLMEGPVESFLWVGGGPTADQSSLGYKDFRTLQEKSQGAWDKYSRLYKKTAYKSLDNYLKSPVGAPWVSVDLDTFFKRPRSEALELCRQTFRTLGTLRELKDLTVAVSRDYLGSDGEAQDLLEAALEEILKWKGVKVTIDGTFHEEERSEWAEDLRKKLGTLPVFDFNNLSPLLARLVKDPRVTLLRSQDPK